MVLVRYCYASSTTQEVSGSGCIGLPSVRHGIKSWSRSPTNSLASHGQYYPAAKTIDTQRCRGPQPDLAVEKTLRLESTKRFPLSHRHDGDFESCSTKVC